MTLIGGARVMEPVEEAMHDRERGVPAKTEVENAAKDEWLLRAIENHPVEKTESATLPAGIDRATGMFVLSKRIRPGCCD